MKQENLIEIYQCLRVVRNTLLNKHMPLAKKEAGEKQDKEQAKLVYCFDKALAQMESYIQSHLK